MKRNIPLFYLLTAVMNFWFIASNWIYFWTKYMTYGQLGWVDALGFGFALLLEIPSGAVADLIGKRKTILVGMTAGAIGVFTIAFSGSLTGIFVGWLITQICYAFYSGAAEALAYDSLVDEGRQGEFDRVISRSSEIESYVGALSALIGGLLFVYSARLPHLLWGSGFAIGVLLSYLLVEPKTDTAKFSLRKYFHQLFVGFRELTQRGLKRYIGFFFTLVGVYFLYSWGLVRPATATSFGFFAREQGFILPSLAVLGAIAVRYIPYLKSKVSDFKGLIILSLIMATGFIMAFFPIGYYGIISMILIALAGKLASPWISIIINKQVESKNRATTLSTMALMTKLPYVLIAVLAGKMLENGTLPVFNLGVGIIVLSVAVGSSAILLFRNYLQTNKDII